MNLIAAVDTNWGLGYEGTQPVVIPEDRRHFREVTGSGTVIVGRRTLADFPGGRPLKGRRNIIMTRDPAFSVPGGETAGSVERVLELTAGEEPDSVFVIGGGSVYRQLLPCCRRAYITWIDAAPPADTYLPDLSALGWTVEEDSGPLYHGETIYRFITYVNPSPEI